jgi:hypothetical protein
MFLNIPGFHSKSNLVLRHQHYLSIGIVSIFVPCLDLDELISSRIVDLNTGTKIFRIGYHHRCIASVKVGKLDGTSALMADESDGHRRNARHCPA